MQSETLEFVKLFSEHEEDVTWVLRQQEKLRLEYIMFLKKDLPEILYRQNIRRRPWNKILYEKTVKSIIDDYSKKIEYSIDILSKDLIMRLNNSNEKK